MKHFVLYLLYLPALFACMPTTARTWTLDACLDYARNHNITLQQAGLTRASAAEDYRSSRAQLLPSLTFQTSQNVAYNPWRNSGQLAVEGGQALASQSTTSYNGSYQIGANYTLWNGNRNHNQARLNALTEQKAAQDSTTQALNLEEQIATLFVQALYTRDAISVNRATLDAARVNEERGKQMYDVGQMSRADLSQLTATRAEDEYNVVRAEAQARDYERQLKALLQLTDTAAFHVASTEPTEAMALAPIPALPAVYEAALEHRPELTAARLAADKADLQRKIARASRLPQVSLNAAVATNSSTLSDRQWADQMKTNMNVGGGLSVSVPIFDQRSARTAINKAEIARREANLTLRDTQTKLYSTIERYYIDATSNQAQYRSACTATQAASDSYNLLTEQFAVGLKNIVELQQGKTRLLTAQQSELQAKYMTILDIKMLELYGR